MASLDASTCQLCGSNEDNVLLYGNLMTQGDVTVHYFCLLFAPNLYQRGKDSEGISGFLISDIENEIKRVKLLYCRYCKTSRANLGCSVSSCKSSYHMSCGRLNNVSLEFVNDFPTYCKSHSKKFNQGRRLKRNDTCGICFEIISSLEAHILIPCCRNSWFHQLCLQKFATTSGVFFKCPLCNDKTTCIDSLQRQGIFIPEKDADWELEGDFFEDVLELEERVCDSENCLIAQSTSHQVESIRWKFCCTCGASSIHELCMSDQNSDFVCNSCSEILNRPKPTVSEPSPETSPKKREFKNFQSWFFDDEPVSSDDEKEHETVSNIRGFRSAAATICDEDTTSVKEESEAELQTPSVRAQRESKEGSSRRLNRDPFVPLFSDDEEVLSDSDFLSPSFARKRKADTSLTPPTGSAYKNSKMRNTKSLFK